MNTVEKVDILKRSTLIRLVASGCIVLVASVVFLFFLLHHQYRNAEQTFRDGLRQHVELARNVIEPVVADVRNGDMTRAEAIHRLYPIVRHMTFTDHTGGNYVYLISYDGTIIAHTFQPELENKSGLEIRDSDGRYIVRDMIETARSSENGGFTSYQYRPPNLDYDQTKVSFVLGIPELQCLIGTGGYINLFDEQEAEHWGKLVLGILLVLLVAVGGLAFSALPMQQAMQICSTERQRLSDALTALEDVDFKYHTIIENTREGIVVVQDGHFVLINPSMETLTGIPLDTLAHMPFKDVIYEEDRGLVEDRYRRRMSGENVPTQYSFRIVTAGGDVRWMLCNTVRIVWKGAPAALAMLTDISEIKKMQDSLEDRETKFRSLMEQAPIPIAIVGLDGTVMEVNDLWRIHWSAPVMREPASGNILQEKQFVANNLTDKFAHTISGEAVVTEAMPYVVGENGEQRWLSLRLYPIQDHRNVTRSVVLLYDDQTERFEAEQRQKQLLEDLSQANSHLRQAQGYVKQVIDSMPSVLICVDETGDVALWNKAASDYFSVREFSTLNKPMHLAHTRLSQLQPLVDQVVSTNRAFRQERVRHDYEGAIRYEDVIIYPLTFGNRGAVLRIDDVTERVRLEEMMIQTEKMMSVGGLAAGMAHEINNPLGGIMQGAQNLRRRLLDDLPVNRKSAEEAGTSLEALHEYMRNRKVDSFLSGIHEAGERAAAIVENMLSFSRKGDALVAQTDVAEIMDKSIELAANDYDLKKKYDFKHIIIERSYAENTPQVYCSPTELEQVFLNLLKNATQALSQGTSDGKAPQLTLSIRPEGQAVRIDVKDNGPGMDEETRSRCFEPFFTTKEVGVGTGLGLSVSYFIITTKHNGRFGVASSAGAGTTFTIHLPVTIA